MTVLEGGQRGFARAQREGSYRRWEVFVRFEGGMWDGEVLVSMGSDVGDEFVDRESSGT